nr:retrovirus-related Pol polyprotein from transposon TNT 1-94 [Tanacetum cinerariifolium]
MSSHKRKDVVYALPPASSGGSGCVESLVSPCCPCKMATYACKAVTCPFCLLRSTACNSLISDIWPSTVVCSDMTLPGTRSLASVAHTQAFLDILTSVSINWQGSCDGGEWEVEAASSLSRIMAARYPKERIGLGGGAGDKMGEGICGGGEDQGDNGDAGGEDIAKSLTTSESVHAGIGTGAGIEILAVVRYAGCGGGVAADSSISNGSVSFTDGASSDDTLQSRAESHIKRTLGRLKDTGKDDFGVEVDMRVLEEEIVPKVDDVSLVDGVFDGAFGRDGEEDVVMGEEAMEVRYEGDEDDEKSGNVAGSREKDGELHRKSGSTFGGFSKTRGTSLVNELTKGVREGVLAHEKFLGTVKFGNDQIAPILGYGDLVQGAVTIKRVYYVKGLNHNLFSVGEFCDSDLEVSFRKSTCFIHDLKGNDLLTGSRGTDLYSITLQDTNSTNPICLMAKATSSQAWLWDPCQSYLNFDTINLLSKNDIVVGLPKIKFIKDHLCSSCELGKAKRKSFHTKLTPSLKRRLQLLHMDLCGPMRVASINEKIYVLVIVDDYSRYTWTHFLRFKDETPENLHAYFDVEGIHHQTSVARTLEQNGIVERRNLIPQHEKTPYHIINYRKPSVKFFYIFGSLCYIVRDGKNLDKMKEKDQVSSDPVPECQRMALDHNSLSPGIQCQQNVPHADKTVTTSNELDLLFSLMFDELLNGSSKVVSKSSAVSSADAPYQRQQHTTPLNNHITLAPTSGSKDRPPMLAPENYIQWKSRIKRYIDTKPNRELIYFCLTNPPYELGWKEKPIFDSKGNPTTTTQQVFETYQNVKQEIRDQLNAEAEAVQIILTGFDNDIYSTVDACLKACEMWKAIKRLKQEWQRFVSLVKQSQELKHVSYHKLYDILKQHQHEVNEIRAEKIARVANPLALVAQQQQVYHPQTHPTHYNQHSSTKTHQAATRKREKAVVNSPQPIYDQEPSMVDDDEDTSKDKEIDKLMALISLSFKKIYKPTNNNLRTSSNTSHANQDNSPQIYRNARYEGQRSGTVARARETVGSSMEEAGIQLNAEQADWKDDTDDEFDDQELEAHYMYMAKLQQVSPDVVDSGP